jgi:hypothetical protein
MEGPEVQTPQVAITRFSLPPIITFVDPPGDLQTTDDRILVVASVVAPGGKLRDVAFLVAEPGESLRGMTAVLESPSPEGAMDSDERVLRQELDLPLGATRARVVAKNERGERSERTLTITRVPKEGHTYLLAVGIDKYPGTKALKCAVADARYFRDFASKHLGVAAKRSWLLTDEEATREAISDKFAELIKAKKEDTVIVFLAGHGHVERLGATEQKYFVPYVEEWGRFYSRAVALSDFERFLSGVRAERILVVADACHSGEVIAMRGGSIFSGLAGRGRIVLGYDGPAREDATLHHGYLTYFLVDGLVTGKADVDRDGAITVREAYRYASREIERITGEGLWIAGEGELVLAR